MQVPVRLKQELELFNVFISSLQPGSGEWKPGRREVGVLLLCGVSLQPSSTLIFISGLEKGAVGQALGPAQGSFSPCS